MKRLFFLIIILCCCHNIFAQRYYSMFNEEDYKSDTIEMNDYTYVCDTLLNYGINIYNITNHPGREDIYYKDGSPITQDVDIIDYSYSANLSLHNIIDEGFTQEQVKLIDGKRLIVLIDISSTDGSITDVYFTFFKDTYYAQLPIEVFRAMELRFKNEVQFELTEEGKKMTHYSLSWSQCPKGRVEEIHNNGENDANTDNIRTDNIGTITINMGINCK